MHVWTKKQIKKGEDIAYQTYNINLTVICLWLQYF